MALYPSDLAKMFQSQSALHLYFQNSAEILKKQFLRKILAVNVTPLSN